MSLHSVVETGSNEASLRVFGDVLNHETIESDELVRGAARGIRMTYVSQGASGERRPVTAVVQVPEGTAPVGGWPVMAYAHGTSGVGEHCTVSNLLALHGDLLAPWIQRGFAVVATDYAGIGTPGGHPYLSSAASGANVIDSVSAARSMVSELSVCWVTMGGSQGGQAAIATAHLSASRAPHLRHVGAIAVCPPLLISRFVALAGPWVPRLPVPDFVTYLAYILAGLRVSRPDVDSSPYLTPLGQRLVDEAPWYGYAQMVERTRGIGVGTMFRRGLRRTPVARAFDEQTHLPTEGYSVPVLVAAGVFDPICPAPLAERFVARARRRGQQFTLHRYVSGHQVGSKANADAIAFSLSVLGADSVARSSS
ncbi:hypothetical protein BHE97_08280 [Aeromicrobium sp. PE09-221]|uniref:lipase family protein n=1 Tax=Aeromicrobium sp. PE09-221 TaxID=1898043 RepID=UPI000B3E837A|nr:lipase family protein [Aeromicrobium sp. PE09-221]OUZ10328.1 hypothetical protein BHE97_08280 [Aeromicrobium sp. PE09-221]